MYSLPSFLGHSQQSNGTTAGDFWFTWHALHCCLQSQYQVTILLVLLYPSFWHCLDDHHVVYPILEFSPLQAQQLHFLSVCTHPTNLAHLFFFLIWDLEQKRHRFSTGPQLLIWIPVPSLSHQFPHPWQNWILTRILSNLLSCDQWWLQGLEQIDYLYQDDVLLRNLETEVLKPSAFAIFSPGWWEMVYWCAARISAHYCSLAEAITGTPRDSLSRYWSGFHHNIDENVLTPNTVAIASLSSSWYFLSTAFIVHEEYAIGFSVPSASTTQKCFNHIRRCIRR